MTETTSSPLNNVITIDDERIKSHLDRVVVRGSVEETLNALVEAEADRLCNAQRYERSEARRDTRAGHYERRLQTKAGEVPLKVPKLRAQTFETAIIERYRRRESSVEEALIEMYLAGVSVRRVEDITEALWGARVSPSTVSGAFPDGQSALNLAAARLRHIAGHRLVDEKILEYGAAEAPADERGHHRLSPCRAPLSPRPKCEKCWTLPVAGRPHHRDLVSFRVQ